MTGELSVPLHVDVTTFDRPKLIFFKIYMYIVTVGFVEVLACFVYHACFRTSMCDVSILLGLLSTHAAGAHSQSKPYQRILVANAHMSPIKTRETVQRFH